MRHEILIGGALAVLAAAAPAMALPADFKAKADALLAQTYAANGPGASVVISEGGRIVYQGNRGMADVATKRPITATRCSASGRSPSNFRRPWCSSLPPRGSSS